MSTGEYVALLDQDDLLSQDALYKNVLALNENNKIDLIYSDEDKMNEKGQRVDPHFKPDWCPDNFLSRNYLGHLLLLKQSILKEIGGFREGYEGSQDYDLLLRYTEKSKVIHHIPEVLYHWRMHMNSTAVNEEAKPYAFNNGIKALEDALVRRGIAGKVNLIENLPGFYSIRYQIDTFKKVSIIIPSKDKADITNTAIESIFNLTTYPNYEVILISNNSSEQSFFDLVTKWKKLKPDNFVYIEDNGNFNFSRLINNAAKVATGDYLLLLNNDVEIIQKDWMTAMVEQAQRESIGVVGVKLLYSNDTVQHAGVVIGLGGVAGHSFVGQERNASGYFYYLKSISNYSALTAACILVKKETFEQVNGFDENLAIEFNDVDFCLKVKELGYNNIYLPHVELYHYESISRGHPHKTRKSYQQSMKEVDYFSNKWTSYIQNDPCYSKHLSLIFTDFRLRVKDH
jgi:GT2 family glycosyltransferase